MGKPVLERVKEYQARNPERVRAANKLYKENNIEKIHAYQVQYYLNVYKQKRKEQIQCQCGRSVSRKHMPIHKRSTIHLKSLLLQQS
jgi:ADP-dependent phosphofructokinase/glucokinase